MAEIDRFKRECNRLQLRASQRSEQQPPPVLSGEQYLDNQKLMEIAPDVFEKIEESKRDMLSDKSAIQDGLLELEKKKAELNADFEMSLRSHHGERHLMDVKVELSKIMLQIESDLTKLRQSYAKTITDCEISFNTLINTTGTYKGEIDVFEEMRLEKRDIERKLNDVAAYREKIDSNYEDRVRDFPNRILV
jgi:hypothetical protein